jgi:hypothetical protein
MYCNVPTHFNQIDEILTVVSSKSWSFRLTITCAIKVVSANPAHGEVYTIQHYVIKICQWLAAGQWFSLGPSVSSTNKTDHHDIAENLLKVALNTISLKYILIKPADRLNKSIWCFKDTLLLLIIYVYINFR